MAYTTRTKVLQLSGVASEPVNPNRDATIDFLIPQVDAEIDRATGTWFEPRNQTFQIKPRKLTERLFLPAVIRSITSVKERGLLLTTLQFAAPTNGFEIIKVGSETGRNFGPIRWATEFFNNNGVMEYPIIIVGSFGEAAVPKDVEGLSTEVVAILAGHKKRTFTTRDGIQQTVNITTYPEYIESRFINRQRVGRKERQLVMA